MVSAVWDRARDGEAVGGNGGRPTEVLRGKLARGGKGLTGPQGEDSLRRGGMCHCLQKM